MWHPLAKHYMSVTDAACASVYSFMHSLLPCFSQATHLLAARIAVAIHNMKRLLLENAIRSPLHCTAQRRIIKMNDFPIIQKNTLINREKKSIQHI